jgi:triacylglycerol esterase/lipase EstA (alpha/beta hydrolase family)
MKRLALTCAAVLLAARAAAADPVLDLVTSTMTKSRAVALSVETTLAAAGEVDVTGIVNGVAVNVRKKLKAGHKTTKITVDPKKLHLKKLTTGLHFDLSVVAKETSSGLQTSQSVVADAPLPCIVLPGFGDEQTGGLAGITAFTTALDLVAGGRYQTSGATPSLVVHSYASLTKSLAALGRELDKAIKSALKGTPFVKVDLVGYSYGGLVTRSYLSQSGGLRVRDCVLLGAPNEGTPLAYIAAGLTSTQLAQLVGSNAALATAIQGLVTDQSKEALRNLYPTYAWANWTNPLTQRVEPAPAFVLQSFADPTTPLTALNAIAPPTGVVFHAFYYSSTGVGQFGTLDVVNVTDLLSAANGSLDPTTLATGAGDGVVASHSVTMNENAAWHAVITGHDMGVGTHVTMPADPNVIAGVAAVLAQ